MNTNATTPLPASRRSESEHEWTLKPSDRAEDLGDYAREVDAWRDRDIHLTHPCGQCQTSVLSGLVCHQPDCVARRTSGPYADATWQVAA